MKLITFILIIILITLIGLNILKPVDNLNKSLNMIIVSLLYITFSLILRKITTNKPV